MGSRTFIQYLGIVETVFILEFAPPYAWATGHVDTEETEPSNTNISSRPLAEQDDRTNQKWGVDKKTFEEKFPKIDLAKLTLQPQQDDSLRNLLSDPQSMTALEEMLQDPALQNTDNPEIAQLKELLEKVQKAKTLDQKELIETAKKGGADGLIAKKTLQDKEKEESKKITNAMKDIRGPSIATTEAVRKASELIGKPITLDQLKTSEDVANKLRELFEHYQSANPQDPKVQASINSYNRGIDEYNKQTARSRSIETSREALKKAYQEFGVNIDPKTLSDQDVEAGLRNIEEFIKNNRANLPQGAEDSFKRALAANTIAKTSTSQIQKALMTAESEGDSEGTKGLFSLLIARSNQTSNGESELKFFNNEIINTRPKDTNVGPLINDLRVLPEERENPAVISAFTKFLRDTNSEVVTEKEAISFMNEKTASIPEEFRGKIRDFFQYASSPKQFDEKKKEFINPVLAAVQANPTPTNDATDGIMGKLSSVGTSVREKLFSTITQTTDPSLAKFAIQMESEMNAPVPVDPTSLYTVPTKNGGSQQIVVPTAEEFFKRTPFANDVFLAQASGYEFEKDLNYVWNIETGKGAWMWDSDIPKDTKEAKKYKIIIPKGQGLKK